VKFAVFVSSAVLLLSTSIVSGGGSEAITIENKTLTLGECIAIGLKTNPTGEISRQGLKAIQEKIGETKAGYYPTLKLSSAYTHTSPALLMSKEASTDNYDNRLAVRQTLFDAGATASLVQGVLHTITAQEYDTTKTGLDIRLTVSTLFIDVLKKQELLTVAKAALSSTEQHRQQSQALYQEGVSPRADVIKSEVQVSTARLTVVSADNAVLFAKASLSAFMGVPVTIAFEVDGQEVERMQHHPLPDVREALDQAYHLRPELMGVKARLAAADAAVNQAASGFYPNVTLDASYGWQESTFVPTDSKWGVGVTVALPVFEQLTTRSKVGQAVANRSGVKASEAQAMRAVELEVQQAWLGFMEAQERQTVAVKALEQATEDMRVSEGRYQEGLGVILEVIDAQTALTQAKTNQVVAVFDIATAQVKLDRATGQRPTEETGK
jgi:outer membrane protein TolC